MARHTKQCVGTLSQAASERSLNKLVPLAACTLSLCPVVGPCAEILVISPAAGRDAAAATAAVKGGCVVADYLMKRR